MSRPRRQRMIVGVIAVVMAIAAASCSSVNDLTPPSCTYGAVPAPAAFDAGGGNGVLAMTAAGVCDWQVSSSATWIALPGATSGYGNGNIPFVVAANTGVTARAASLSTAAGPISISQSGAACTYSVSPESVRLGPNGGGATITVTTAGACPWTATSAHPWIAIARGASNTGNGTAEIVVERLTETTGRTGSVTVAGRVIEVVQDGGGCSIGISPSTANVPAAGGSGTLQVSADDACSWSVASEVSWISVVGEAAGRGNRTVTYSVPPNPDTSSRTGRITVGNQALTITQAAAGAAPPPPPPPSACTYTVAPLAFAVDAAGGNRSATVTTGANCAWTAAANATWLSITGGASGTGNGSVTITIAANATTAARTGTLTIAGRTVTVDQAGVPCTYALSPTSKSFDEKAHSDHVTLDTLPGCQWTAVSDAAWLVITTSPPSGTGDARIDYSVSANNSTNSRTGTITVAGETMTVTQKGK